MLAEMLEIFGSGADLRRPFRSTEADAHRAIPAQTNDNWPAVLTRSKAANMCAISIQTFDAWVRKGILPGPIPGPRRWSRDAIQVRLAGEFVASLANDQLSPFEQWKRGNAH
jgi:hypothetical protein